MIDLNIGPSPTILLTLLKVEGVVLVGLVGGPADQPIEHDRIVLDAGTSYYRKRKLGNIFVKRKLKYSLLNTVTLGHASDFNVIFFRALFELRYHSNSGQVQFQ